MENLINRDGQLDIEFTNSKDIEYKLIDDFFRILPNGKIIVNQISNIKVLEKVKFENLKELDLIYNKISEIKVLENVKFENLKNIIIFRW